MKTWVPYLKSQLFDKLSEEEFFNFCQEQKNIRIEKNSSGEILIMSPNLPESSLSNVEVTFQLTLWNKKHKLGLVFESSAGFALPNGAMRAPDCSWISHHRWNTRRKDTKGFPHICPEFVVEIRSSSDSLKILKSKMEEWISNGCLLGWLIDVKAKKVYVYREDGSKEIKTFEDKITGEAVLPKFILQANEL